MDTLKIAIDALLDIKNTQGKVCSEYEICTHTSCQSSYNSWAIADKALREIASQHDVEADDYKYCDCGDKSTPINIGPVVLGCRSCHKEKVYKDYKKDIGVFPEPKSTA